MKTRMSTQQRSQGPSDISCSLSRTGQETVRGPGTVARPKISPEKPTSSENCSKQSYPVFSNPATSQPGLQKGAVQSKPAQCPVAPAPWSFPGKQGPCDCQACVQDSLRLSPAPLPCPFRVCLPVEGMGHMSPGEDLILAMLLRLI